MAKERAFWVLWVRMCERETEVLYLCEGTPEVSEHGEALSCLGTFIEPLLSTGQWNTAFQQLVKSHRIGL